MLIDLHADTPLWQHWTGYDFCREHAPWLPMGAWLSNVDLPRMEDARMDAQLFGLVALPFEFDGYSTIQAMLRRMREAVDKSQGGFVLVRSGAELRAARARGQRVGMLSIEGVHSLRGRMDRADELIDQGVISFGLVHFHRNAAASPAIGWGAWGSHGLTAFGRDLVAHLAARKIVVDLAHVNRRGFFEALQASDGPVMVSHTGVRGVYDIARNIDDEQIRAVADRGGIVGIIFSRHFLGGSDMQAVVRHIIHVVRVGGPSCAALGSDFDGFIVPVRGLRDIRGLHALGEALRRAGLSAHAVDCVMGQNALRFLTESRG